MASITMMAPRTSGFSASAPAPAAPIRDCTHAVAMAEMPTAIAADRASSTLSICDLLPPQRASAKGR